MYTVASKSSSEFAGIMYRNCCCG